MRRTRGTWRMGTDVDNSASNWSQYSIGLVEGVVNVRGGSVHGVKDANYTSAGGAHMGQASAWCVDKHGTGSARMKAMRISAVGMVREHGNEECQCQVQRTCMNWAGPLSKKCLM